MPNHFHLLLRQFKEGGIQEFISKVINSYTKYFNTKHDRVGHLFQGQFKSVAVDTNEQLVHVSRYIHLNPYVADLEKHLDNYPHSSYVQFTKADIIGICNTEPVLELFKDKVDYQQFVNDHTSYAVDIYRIKPLIAEDY